MLVYFFFVYFCWLGVVLTYASLFLISRCRVMVCFFSHFYNLHVSYFLSLVDIINSIYTLPLAFIAALRNDDP